MLKNPFASDGDSDNILLKYLLLIWIGGLIQYEVQGDDIGYSARHNHNAQECRKSDERRTGHASS
jgi:hypothetical protein